MISNNINEKPHLIEQHFKLIKLNMLFSNFTIEELGKFISNNNSKVNTYKSNTVIYFEGEKALNGYNSPGLYTYQKSMKKGIFLQ